MNAQKRDIVIGEREVWGNQQNKICEECRLIIKDNPSSCFCKKCENEFYRGIK